MKEENIKSEYQRKVDKHENYSILYIAFSYVLCYN